jgi:hypothetical protein
MLAETLASQNAGGEEEGQGEERGVVAGEKVGGEGEEEGVGVEAAAAACLHLLPAAGGQPRP